MLEPCKRCFYTIMANYHGSLEAVDCHIHSVRCDNVLESIVAAIADASSGHLRRCNDADTPKKCFCRRSWRPSQMLHQVTYDVVTTLIRPTNA
eukprot:scaffold39079_cov105-Skeletonema_marinoi.AAC.6